MANGLKLEGQRFGHLTVLKKLDERENRYVVWLCRCDCGNEIKVNTRHLMRGTVKDCGCIPENSAKRGPVAEDLTGRRFGKLVAVKKLESKNGRTRWECRCDCGNMHISTAHSLKAGKCTSCGMENTVLPSDSRGNDFISELLWIIRMRSRPARKRNLPSTKALSAPGTAGTGRQKKIPAGPEIIPWYTRSNGSTESFR